MISKKQKKVCTTLNYIEHFLILASAITERSSISEFTSLIGIPRAIASFATGLKICTAAAGIKKYESIIKKKKKNHDKILVLAKSKLNSIEVLIFKTFDSVISHDEFVLMNNGIKEYITKWNKK